MPRNWTLQWEPYSVDLPAANYADHDTLPTSGAQCNAFDPAAANDESVYLTGIVPAEHTGSGTLKLDILACANTTTAADDARIDVATEFRTPGAAEAMSVDNFDATPDSGTLTFSTTAYSLQKLTITLTPAVTPAVGDKFRVRVTRDANNAGGLDDLAVPLLVLGYELYEDV